MDKEKLYLTVSSATLAKVYPDFIPIEASYPAIAYTHIANGGGRLLSGTRTGLWDTWRISVAANTREGVKVVADEIELLDGTSNANYQSIQVLNIMDEPADINSNVFMMFVDIKTYG